MMTPEERVLEALFVADVITSEQRMDARLALNALERCPECAGTKHLTIKIGGKQFVTKCEECKASGQVPVIR